MLSLTQLKWAAIALAVAVAFSMGWRINGWRIQSAWDAEKAALNAEAAKQIQEAMDRALSVERAAAKRVTAVSAKYQNSLKEKQSEEAAAIDRARTDGLYINARCEDAAGAVPSASDATSGHHGEARARLPDATAEALLQLAAEADRVTEQLTACQHFIEEERK